MQKIIKRAALFALVMQVCIFLMAHVVAFLYIPIRMILSEHLIQDAVFGVITLVIEFLVRDARAVTYKDKLFLGDIRIIVIHLISPPF